MQVARQERCVRRNGPLLGGSDLAGSCTAQIRPGLMDPWTHESCAAAGVELGHTHRIWLAGYVASYDWEGQYGGDQTNVSNLRDATRLGMELAS